MLSRTLAFALMLVAAPISIGRAQSHAVPEPAGLWPGPMHSSTPASLKAATVVDAKRLLEIVRQDHPAMVDVSNLDHRPLGLAPGAMWSPIHRSLPAARWWPGAGQGTNDPKFAGQFAAEAEKLTGGDKSKPIVTFCHPNRWGSWNAGKRLVELGYTNVYWFPGGAEGWADAGQRLVAAEPAQVFKVERPAKAAESTPKEPDRCDIAHLTNFIIRHSTGSRPPT